VSQFIHDKNMKYISANTQAWVDKHLAHFGILLFGGNVIDLKHNTYLPAPGHYGLYCEYMEKKHHLHMAARLQPGFRHWSMAEPLYQLGLQVSAPNQTLHVFDWTLKTEHGFELFYVMSYRLLQPQHLFELRQWLNVYSAQVAEVIKYKPKAVLELENGEALLDKHQNFGAEQIPPPFAPQAAQFGDLVLTGKEQTYLKHVLLQQPYSDIAARYQVREVAVRNVIYDIKRKLGAPTMPMSEMFAQLQTRGAIAACL
jgi:DNA-binding CsgD family transcriptional regulator